MTPLPSRQTSGKHPGKQIRKGLGLWGSMRTRNGDTSGSGVTCSREAAGYDRFRASPMPKVAVRPLRRAFYCFPPASPPFVSGPGKQKRPRRAAFIRLISLKKLGAGEGIRTLDPNLGKVEVTAFL